MAAGAGLLGQSPASRFSSGSLPQRGSAYQPRAAPWGIDHPRRLQPVGLPYSPLKRSADGGPVHGPFRAKPIHRPIPRALPRAGMSPRLQRFGVRSSSPENVVSPTLVIYGGTAGESVRGVVRRPPRSCRPANCLNNITMRAERIFVKPIRRIDLYAEIAG